VPTASGAWLVVLMFTMVSASFSPHHCGIIR
jgi:hypothetical protein